MSDAEELTERLVAGVALEPWVDEMTLTDHPVFGSATLRRAAHSAHLRHGELVLTIDGPARESLLASAGAETATRVRFAMAPWTFEQSVLEHAYGTPPEGVDCWRALIARHGLLSHPEWLWREQFGGGDEPGGEAGAALRSLRERFSTTTGRSSQDRTYRPACDACAALERARVLEQERVSPGRVPWVQPIAARSQCPHRDLAGAALRAICQRWPAVAFELIGWLLPVRGIHLAIAGGWSALGDDLDDLDDLDDGGDFDDGDPDDEEDLDARDAPSTVPPVAAEPTGTRRYVLAPSVVQAALQTWLLGESVAQNFHRYGYGPRERRWTFRTPHGLDGTVGLSREQRAAMALAATTWGMGNDVDALRPAESPGQIALDADAAPPVPGLYAMAESVPAGEDGESAREVTAKKGGVKKGGVKKGRAK